jgi:hypothetical protein
VAVMFFFRLMAVSLCGSDRSSCDPAAFALLLRPAATLGDDGEGQTSVGFEEASQPVGRP